MLEKDIRNLYIYLKITYRTYKTIYVCTYSLKMKLHLLG